MAKRQVYVRDNKGRFAHTGTSVKRQVSRKTTAKKVASTKKKTTTVKKVAQPKAAPVAKPKVNPYSAQGIRKARRGKSTRNLARATDLKPAQVRAILAKWEASGVPSGFVRQASKNRSNLRLQKPKPLGKRKRPTRKRPVGWD